MREKPILFNAAMVQAILEGRKTQTRRVIKPQPEYIDDEPKYIKNTWAFWGDCDKYQGGLIVDGSPYGEIGDKLWVRETWHEYRYRDENGKHKIDVIYKADDEGWEVKLKWKPSIFMPKKYARIWLEVTDVRVERLQEITREEATKEGVCPLENKLPEENFRVLWDSINKKRGYGWETNPYVWVINFEQDFNTK